METWWSCEMPNAQAAYDAVSELILNDSRDDVTGLGAVLLGGRMIATIRTSSSAAGTRLGQSRGIDELLDDHGRCSSITWPELVEREGLQFHGSRDAQVLRGRPH